MPFGFSAVSGDESILFTDNFSVDGSERGSSGGKFTTDGQLMIGATAGRHVRIGTLSSSDSSLVVTNGAGTIDLTANGSVVGKTITGDSGGALSPTLGNWNILGLGETSTSGSGSTLSILSPRAYKYIVDPTLNNGTHQTITAALAAASSGETIGIRPGTYTEDLTLKDGVNIVGLTGSSFYGSVKIKGKLSASFAGTCLLQNLFLETNADYIIETTGANATKIELYNCHLNATDNSLINCASTSSGNDIRMYYCTGDLTTTGINYFAIIAGSFRLQYCYFANSAVSVTPSTAGAGATAGGVNMQHTTFNNAITSAGTSSINAGWCYFGNNGSTLICGGSGSHAFGKCSFATGSSTSLTINTPTTLNNCDFTSTASYAIDGSSTLSYSNLAFISTAEPINPTVTQSILVEGPIKWIGDSYPGGENYLFVQNTDATGATNSSAAVKISANPSSIGDAYLTTAISGTRSYCWGIDNSDSDKLKINMLASGGVTPSTGTNFLTMTTAGEMTLPLQPGFLAYLGTTDANQTGDGTAFLLGDTDVGTALTEVYDNNSDFLNGGASGAIFTAPVTGKYAHNFQITLLGNDGNSVAIDLITSNRTYRFQMMNPTSIQDTGGNASYQGSIVADMDASDTAYIQIVESGGTKITDIRGTTTGTERTFWSAWLAG